MKNYTSASLITINSGYLDVLVFPTLDNTMITNSNLDQNYVYFLVTPQEQKYIDVMIQSTTGYTCLDM